MWSARHARAEENVKTDLASLDRTVDRVRRLMALAPVGG
jgi:hypothetical protein